MSGAGLSWALAVAAALVAVASVGAWRGVALAGRVGALAGRAGAAAGVGAWVLLVATRRAWEGDARRAAWAADRAHAQWLERGVDWLLVAGALAVTGALVAEEGGREARLAWACAAGLGACAFASLAWGAG